METSNSQSNKVFIKAVITGALILAMLIPTLFITNLVAEREQRQAEVVREVSSKWSAAQRITGPYISVPYTETYINNQNKRISEKKNLLLLAENLKVDGEVIPQKAYRSIYQVLLYKSQLSIDGNFNIRIPEDIDKQTIDWSRAKLCIGISDFKGIEEKINLKLGAENYSLSPGLPTTEIDETGLSAPIKLTPEILAAKIPFSTSLKIKGSSQLHFLPLSTNSHFALRSSWPSPSFEGNSLPTDRVVTDKGFTSTWSFNEANLPYGPVIKQGTFKEFNTAFGVNMLQPADHYAKTMRSVKYAILFIGLTFALFFIIELMQKNPFHPVQYILVGLALVIFYSLLLSFSEFIAFDIAYLVAALATISLITLYAHSHFKSWKIATIFALVLSGLYSFIFILIRLEDTSLLVGSIGLFIILALVMYASRKVDWYGQARPAV